MTDYDAATYGDRMAEVYDEWFAVPSDTEDTVEFLSDLAGAGPVLELGIGTSGWRLIAWRTVASSSVCPGTMP